MITITYDGTAIETDPRVYKTTGPLHLARLHRARVRAHLRATGTRRLP